MKHAEGVKHVWGTWDRYYGHETYVGGIGYAGAGGMEQLLGELGTCLGCRAYVGSLGQVLGAWSLCWSCGADIKTLTPTQDSKT